MSVAAAGRGGGTRLGAMANNQHSFCAIEFDAQFFYCPFSRGSNSEGLVALFSDILCSSCTRISRERDRAQFIGKWLDGR
jgi:hypothetical protein